MSENAQITAEIERILDERDANAAENLKKVAVVGAALVVGYVMTRRVVYKAVKRQARKNSQKSA